MEHKHYRVKVMYCDSVSSLLFDNYSQILNYLCNHDCFLVDYEEVIILRKRREKE